MGKTRHDTVKIKNQCESCRERRGAECALGLSVLCKRQSSKKMFVLCKKSCIKKLNDCIFRGKEIQ